MKIIDFQTNTRNYRKFHLPGINSWKSSLPEMTQEIKEMISQKKSYQKKIKITINQTVMEWYITTDKSQII